LDPTVRTTFDANRFFAFQTRIFVSLSARLLMKKLILAFAALVALSVMPAMAQQKGAPSYIAVESNSGKILFSSNAEKERPISSLAQVATALVALDWVERTKVELNRIITVPQEAYAITMGNPMNLRPGDRITLAGSR
jgi:D-alanyl-D-alanine carboxypeptidase (penicillin-binding protein 5/6)